MGSIKDFFIDAKGKLILGCLSALILLFFVNRWNYSRYVESEKKAQRWENNFQAAQDTIRVTKTKNNQIEYDKRAYVANIKELKKINADLAKEVEITKGNVTSIAKAGFQVIHDSIYVPTTVYIEDSVVILRSKLDTTFSPGNFRGLSFESKYDSKSGKANSIILEDKIGFTAVVGIKINDKKQREIFVRPNYPGMQVGLLEGAIIEDAEPKTITKIPLVTIGGNVGLVPFTYDWKTKKTDVNLNRIGVSLGFNFNLGAIFK